MAEGHEPCLQTGNRMGEGAQRSQGERKSQHRGQGGFSGEDQQDSMPPSIPDGWGLTEEPNSAAPSLRRLTAGQVERGMVGLP